MSEEDKAILVIDSERSWLEFCAAALKKNGYTVYTALTSQVAQELLATGFAAKIALVLIDIKSLEKDEISIAALSRPDDALKRSVVVVFPTGLTPNKARAAFKLGASDCVSKPYDETSLLALVEQMVADYRVAAIGKKPLSKGSGKVLVVDDDSDWLNDLVKYLPSVDQVVTASEYKTAVEQISLEPFDLVVVDLRLVDEDDNFQGMDLIRMIRDKDREHSTFTQVIIVSAHGTPEHIREAYRAFNIYYYFDKRYLSPSKYSESVREALNC